MHLFHKTRSHETRGALLGGVGLGALLMYVFDPERGARRRALARDKAIHLYKKTGELLSKRSRDLRNRSKGVAAKTRSLLEEDVVPDKVLAERVRSRIGHVVSHPGAIEVSARHRVVTVSGPILAREVDELLETVRKTPGVEDVDIEHLDIHEHPDSVPPLQGNPKEQRRTS